MKEFHLQIIHPGGNNTAYYRTPDVIVDAESVIIKNGAYVFQVDGALVASYPVQYTIIKNINKK